MGRMVVSKASKLSEYTDKLQALKNTVCGSLIAIGGLLHEIEAEELFKEQYETFHEFLGSPEVSMSRGTAYKAMRIYETFVLKHDMKGITDIDPDKLYRIAGVVDENNVDEWVDKARALSRSDLNAEIRIKQGKKPKDPFATVKEKVEEFLNEYCVEQNIDPLKMEVEELLIEYEKWNRQ